MTKTMKNFKLLILSAVATLMPLSALALPQNLNERITWEIVDTTLIIQGVGDMPDFKAHMTPWSFQSIGLAVKDIIVSEGITSIGDFAFCNPGYNALSQRTAQMGSAQTRTSGTPDADSDYYGCLNNVKRVHLPSTIRKIGQCAFQGLNITHINIPESVNAIGAQAFNLSGLRYIKFPATLRKIGYGAFESCVNLECVDFNGAQIKLPKGAFFDCEQLYQLLNTERITSVHDLTFDASPIAKVNNIMAFLKAPNIDRYLGINMMPWGEYVEQFLPNPPAMSKEDQDMIKRQLRLWRRANSEMYSEVLEREFLDSIYVDIATTLINYKDNAEYLSNHQIISARYEGDQQTVVKEYYDFLTKSNAALFSIDEFELEPYDGENHTILITSTHHGNFRVMVPKDEAADFFEAWPEIRHTATARYVHRDDNVRLRNASFVTPEGKPFAAAPIQ